MTEHEQYIYDEIAVAAEKVAKENGIPAHLLNQECKGITIQFDEKTGKYKRVKL